MQTNQFVTSFVEGFNFAIEIEEIKEINQILEVTIVPNTDDYIKGLINLRGKIVTIFDLGLKLGLKPIETTKLSHNII